MHHHNSIKNDNFTWPIVLMIRPEPRTPPTWGHDPPKGERWEKFFKRPLDGDGRSMEDVGEGKKTCSTKSLGKRRNRERNLRRPSSKGGKREREEIKRSSLFSRFVRSAIERGRESVPAGPVTAALINLAAMKLKYFGRVPRQITTDRPSLITGCH